MVTFFVSTLLILSLSSYDSNNRACGGSVLSLFSATSSVSTTSSSRTSFGDRFTSICGRLLQCSQLFSVCGSCRNIMGLGCVGRGTTTTPIGTSGTVVSLLLFNGRTCRVANNEMGVTVNTILSL